jgi:hypothetical protein
LRAETEICLLQAGQAEDHQSRSDQEHDRERHFGSNQECVRPVFPASPIATAARLLEDLSSVDAPSTQRRQYANDEAGEDGDEHRQAEHPKVNVCLAQPRQSGRRPETHRLYHECGDANAKHPAYGGHHRTLRQELPEDMSALRAERDADRQLTLLADVTHERETGHIGAGKQQDERSSAQQQQEGGANAPHHGFMQFADSGTDIGIDQLCQRRQLRLSLRGVTSARSRPISESEKFCRVRSGLSGGYDTGTQSSVAESGN